MVCGRFWCTGLVLRYSIISQTGGWVAIEIASVARLLLLWCQATHTALEKQKNEFYTITPNVYGSNELIASRKETAKDAAEKRREVHPKMSI